MSALDVAKSIAKSGRAAFIVKKMWRELCITCREKARLKPSLKVQEFCPACQKIVIARMRELQKEIKP